MRTFALLLLAPLAAAQDVQIKTAAELPVDGLIERLGTATGTTYLYAPADLRGRVVGGKYDFAVPQERASDAADFLIRQCGLDAKPFPPVKVVFPKNAAETHFRATGLELDLQFDRGPGAWAKPEDAVGSLSSSTVEALLGEARAGQKPAFDLLTAMGPRTPPVIDALSKLLAEPAARAKAALTLARFGHASRPVLPALREAAKADPALEPLVREIEAARHPALLDPALATDTAPSRFVVRFATTKGDFDVEIHRDWAPIGVDRFWNLVRIGFYDGGRFFRVVPGFVAQFGKTGVPEVDKVWYPATIKDDAVRESNSLGYLTFATSGKDARSTQVFVNLADNPNLDKKGFAPIGRVVKGLDVVRTLYDGYGETPDQDVLHYKGDRYFEENFPKLDRITAATIVE